MLELGGAQKLKCGTKYFFLVAPTQPYLNLEPGIHFTIPETR